MKRVFPFVLGGFVCLCLGCGSGTSSAPSGLKSTAFKKGGYARILNASGAIVGLSVGTSTITSSCPPGGSTSFSLVARGTKDVIVREGANEVFKEKTEIESEKTITVVAYEAGGKLAVKILPDLPRYGDSAGAIVQVANFAGQGLGATGSGGADLGSNLAMGAVGPVVKAGAGSFSADIVKGGKKVASASLALEDGQAYTVLIMPGPQPGSIRAAIHQNTVKMEASVGGLSPN